eukprot:6200422-Pleurochrysis_carterae.AAC.5
MSRRAHPEHGGARHGLGEVCDANGRAKANERGVLVGDTVGKYSEHERLRDPVDAHAEPDDNGAHLAVHVLVHLLAQLLCERALDRPTVVQDLGNLRTRSLGKGAVGAVKGKEKRAGRLEAL